MIELKNFEFLAINSIWLIELAGLEENTGKKWLKNRWEVLISCHYQFKNEWGKVGEVGPRVGGNLHIGICKSRIRPEAISFSFFFSFFFFFSRFISANGLMADSF